MKFDSVGLDPDLAANYAVHLYDLEKTPEARVKLLLNNSPPPLIESSNSPSYLDSNRSIDINVGELLGIAMVGMYYNWVGEGKSHTYQSVVGVEDSQKRHIETVLSDGAIWSDVDKKRMLFQQVLVQGYHPQRDVDSDMVAAAVNHKVAVRYKYPDNCGLIVNVYSDSGAIDFREVASKCDLSSYTIVFVNVYQLPDLKQAIGCHLDSDGINNDIPPRTLTVNLARNFLNSGWTYNYSDAQHNSNSSN